MVYTAYWFRYPIKSPNGGHDHYAVVSDSLDNAFKKVQEHTGFPIEDITYLNRELQVLF